MNFGTAASIGLELLQKHQGLGAGIGSATGLGKLAGQGFAKIAERFDLPKSLAKPVGQAVESLANMAGSTGGMQVMNAMQFFDANGNGSVSRDEISQGMQKLREAGLSNSGSAAKLYQMGDQMLQNYDSVAGLDHNGAANGISYKDIGKLMAQDGHQANLSAADWKALGNTV